MPKYCCNVSDFQSLHRTFGILKKYLLTKSENRKKLSKYETVYFSRPRTFIIQLRKTVQKKQKIIESDKKQCMPSLGTLGLSLIPCPINCCSS